MEGGGGGGRIFTFFFYLFFCLAFFWKGCGVVLFGFYFCNWVVSYIVM